MRGNKRVYIGEGYRLEMTTYNNSTQATLRKIHDDYLHAALVDALREWIFQSNVYNLYCR